MSNVPNYMRRLRMGKFRCECDQYTFSDTVLPNDKYFSLVPSELVWETPEKISPNNEIEIWECPECKGLTRFDGTAYRTCYYKQVDDVVTDMVTTHSDDTTEPIKSATPTPMNDTQPTGLDLDEILDWQSNAYDTAKANGMDGDWWDYEFLLGMYREEAKQALTRWGLEQRIDELNTVMNIYYNLWKFDTPTKPLRDVVRDRIAELQANLQDGGNYE